MIGLPAEMTETLDPGRKAGKGALSDVLSSLSPLHRARYAPNAGPTLDITG
jgi:hypothetical protein